jgi:glycosyltransferase involved in cell wall biosynthesis
MTVIAKTLCWITPDYFLDVDARVVPHLAQRHNINWILIKTHNSRRQTDGLLNARVRPQCFALKYRQRDPRIIRQYCELLAAIKKTKPHLIYFSFHGLPYFFPCLSLFVDRAKIIYAVHNVRTPRGAVHEGLMRAYQQFAFRVVDKFHVFSRYQLEEISKLLPNKKHYYAPLALEHSCAFRGSPTTDKIRFLFFGNIREYKRLDLLLEAFQDLYRLGAHNIELMVAGDCPNWNSYQSMITNGRAITTRIEPIPNKDVPALINACHYLVLPYQDGAQSGVLQLAYQYNKPVITSDIDAFRHTVVEGVTGFLFRSESRESLLRVLQAVVANHGHAYEPMRLRIKEFVEREYSIQEIVSKYDAFLSEGVVG